MGHRAGLDPPSHTPLPPPLARPLAQEQGGNAAWKSLAGARRQTSEDWEGHPAPGAAGPLWDFQKHWRGSEMAAVPTELLGAGQQIEILICLRILFSCLAGRAGQEKCVSALSWV